jgi:hypothetical protein
LPRAAQNRAEDASEVRSAGLGQRDQRSRREFPAGGIGNRPGDEKGDAGLRRDAGDDIAFEVDRKGTRVTPSAAFFCLGCEDRSGAEHRAFEGADLPGESGHAGLEMFRCRPTVADGHNLSRYYDITRAQIRRQGAGNTEAHQAIRALNRFLDESGRALPVSGADHDGKSRRARDLRFRGEA